MKTQLINQFGDPSVFELSEIPKPDLKPGHVLIKVYATSVNQIDCKIRSGAVSAISPDFPAILHGDFAGVIDSVASDVTNFKVQDEVYGCAGGLKGSGGALAEFMLVDAKLIALKPKSLSMLEAAALPLVSITAWEALFKKARLTRKNSILKPWPHNLFISADINSSIIIPLETAYLLDKNTHIDNILVRLKHQPNITLAKTQIGSVMHDLLPSSKVSFNSPEQLINLIAKQRETYTMLLIAIGSISLAVGGIGVMNIMLVSVVERRREIGIRMAIGARQSDILRMFLIESVMLTIFGGFLGVVVGVLTSYVLSVFSHWQFYFYGAPVILGFAVSVLVGILSGFYPAWRASKLDPVQAMAM